MLIRTFVALLVFGLLTQIAGAQTESWEQQGWQTDFSKTTIDLSSVVNVIGRDAIPSIDDPQFGPVGDAAGIPGTEPVIALALEGTARAYPIRYMMWHEIVNDVVAGRPVAVTYCPLCNTAVVFDRVIDGAPVEFGTTGKLRHSDLIMYDRRTQSWWQQFNGEGIAGEYAGRELDMLPAAMISMEQFRARYPDGEVLLADPRRAGQSGNNPYVDYDNSAFPFLFRGELPEDINPMMRVALVQSEPAVAVTLPYLQQNAPVELGGYVFTWAAGQNSALDTAQISAGKDVGTIEVFAATPDGPGDPVPHTVTFAFAARAFLPDLAITQLDE